MEGYNSPGESEVGHFLPTKKCKNLQLHIIESHPTQDVIITTGRKPGSYPTKICYVVITASIYKNGPVFTIKIDDLPAYGTPEIKTRFN